MSRKKKNKFGGFKRDLRNDILQVLQVSPKKAINHKQIAASLGISDSGVRTLIFEILIEEVANGHVLEVERGKFLPAKVDTQSMEGVIDISRYGRGYVSIPGFDDDIEIEKGRIGFALQGDTVEIEVFKRGRKLSGRVIRVAQRCRKRYVGTIQLYKEHAFFLPSDKKIHVDFFIPKHDLNGAHQDDKVVVEIVKWENPEHKPFAKVIEVLGQPGSHQVEMNAIIYEYDLPTAFPEAVHLESEAISTAISEEEIAKRKDFRKTTTFTIDPYDAKDFDDALSFEKLENGHLNIGVHIADVSHYVLPNTLLEKEALKRATSVYLVDRTIPMLPEKLSNELCSLRPNEDKLCFSAVFEMNMEGEIIHKWFGRTIIHSDHRFTYEEAQEIIEGKTGPFEDEIRTLNELAKKLRAKRFKKGSIDFDSDEVKFMLDETGKPTGVFIKKMKDSNQLIEDFMLLANREVAAYIGKKTGEMQRPFVYRIHDTPSPEKINQLRTFIGHLGYKLPKAREIDHQNTIKALLDQVKDQPEESSVRIMAIRAMAKAEYSTHNIGHFGLAFDYYTHFTSPIRRYPDVMVHRLLQHYLDQGKPVSESELELKCKHSSMQEKKAAEAERASIRYKQVEYLLARKGETFEARVSGMNKWSLFAETLDTRCEGAIPIESISGDRFEFIAEQYVLRGMRRREEIHLGDRILVRVKEGNLEDRIIVFEKIES
ncbi:MAG: ribonuclease R [Bacteroidota bacterium]